MIKQLIQKTLNQFGWELRKIPPVPPSDMITGLTWLKEQGIEIHTILDVGASDGRWSKECMEVFPDARYYLFEPHPAHKTALVEFDERFSNVRADTRAVGAEDGTVSFDASDLYGGGLDPEGKSEASIEVSQVKIDTCVPDRKLKGPFLIKLDTHGYEKGILEGAENTLKFTNALIVECYNFLLQPEAWLFWELCHFLHSRGFRPVKMVDVLNRKVDQSLWQMDLFFIRDTWEGFSNISYK